jgi:hypothetical protein
MIKSVSNAFSNTCFSSLLMEAMYAISLARMRYGPTCFASIGPLRGRMWNDDEKSGDGCTVGYVRQYLNSIGGRRRSPDRERAVKPDTYERLYELQDDVMRAVFSRQLGFYLTGGTALSRFHLNHRYSDDLDFFTHEINSFGDAVRMLRSDLDGLFAPVISEVDAREFKRLLIRQTDQKLKVDFVADRAPRVGVPEDRDGAYVDTVRNILSNKVGAVLSRDEARDVADLLQISRSYRFPWSVILQEAFQKQQFEREELVYRLSSFPVRMLSEVPYRGPAPDAREAETLIRAIANDVESGGENSLAQADAPKL